MRQFRSPNGRDWTADLYEVPEGVGVATRNGVMKVSFVLRFESDDVTLDLASFPADWEGKSDEELLLLLRQACTPAFAPLAVH
jgi:hypothetical protein